jgi:hypothetical protein
VMELHNNNEQGSKQQGVTVMMILPNPTENKA